MYTLGCANNQIDPTMYAHPRAPYRPLVVEKGPCTTKSDEIAVVVVDTLSRVTNKVEAEENKLFATNC